MKTSRKISKHVIDGITISTRLHGSSVKYSQGSAGQAHARSVGKVGPKQGNPQRAPPFVLEVMHQTEEATPRCSYGVNLITTLQTPRYQLKHPSTRMAYSVREHRHEVLCKTEAPYNEMLRSRQTGNFSGPCCACADAAAQNLTRPFRSTLFCGTYRIPRPHAFG